MADEVVSKTLLLKEVELCDVVCANCHRRRTHRRQGSYRVTFTDED